MLGEQGPVGKVEAPRWTSPEAGREIDGFGFGEVPERSSPVGDVAAELTVGPVPSRLAVVLAKTDEARHRHRCGCGVASDQISREDEGQTVDQPDSHEQGRSIRWAPGEVSRVGARCGDVDHAPTCVSLAENRSCVRASVKHRAGTIGRSMAQTIVIDSEGY